MFNYYQSFNKPTLSSCLQPWKSGTIAKRHTLALTVCVNKTQIKISLSLYPFQITSWSGWMAAGMTSTLPWSQCQNPEVELELWQIQILIGQKDPWPLTSWLLTLQWPCDKDYQHDVQQTSCLKKTTQATPGKIGLLQITPDLLSRLPKRMGWIC